MTGGVRLAWQVVSPTTETRYSQTLKDTHDWTLLEMETPDVGRGRQAAVRFIQAGAGQSWLDDLEVIPIP